MAKRSQLRKALPPPAVATAYMQPTLRGLSISRRCSRSPASLRLDLENGTTIDRASDVNCYAC